MPPDRGHLIADEIGKAGVKPGHSRVGRLDGLAEVRGIPRTFPWLEAQGAYEARSNSRGSR
jgi:mannonate dehydratase